MPDEEDSVMAVETSEGDGMSSLSLQLQAAQSNKLISKEPVKVYSQAEELKGWLSMIEKGLQTDPDSEELSKYLESTLIDAKNFFLNIAQLGSTSDEVRMTERAIDFIALGFEPLEIIREYNELAFRWLGRGKYEFGQRWKEEKDYKIRLIERLQIPKTVIDLETDSFLNRKMTGHNITIHKTAYIFNEYVSSQAQDLCSMISGFPGSGKSSLAIWFLLRILELRDYSMNMKTIRQILKEKIIYTESSTFKNEVLQLEKDIRLIDEGFFMVFNEETMKRTMRELTKNLYATRNRRNIYFFNISDPTMATKPFQKRILPLFYIPIAGEVKFLCRSKILMNTTDPLGLKPLENVNNERSAMWWIEHNPNYLTSFTFTKLAPRVEKEYNKLKDEAQKEKAEIDEAKQERDEMDEWMIQDGIKEYQSGNTDLITYYLQQKFKKSAARKMADEVYFRTRKVEYKLRKEGNTGVGTSAEEEVV